MSKIKVSAGWVSFEASLLGLQIVSSLCVSSHDLSSSYKDTSQIGFGPIHMTSFYLNYLFKGPISKYSHILCYQGLELQHMNYEGMQFSP